MQRLKKMKLNRVTLKKSSLQNGFEFNFKFIYGRSYSNRNCKNFCEQLMDKVCFSHIKKVGMSYMDIEKNFE